MSRYRTALSVIVVAGLLAATPSRAAAYSVFAHEAVVDALWQEGIVPLLKRRFPHASASDLQAARAYAYGGSLIQDLGYYPFGSHFFSNLVHYVRSGDFVEALVHDAQDVNEYAFALGALAHYSSDEAGHPLAVNRVVPEIYPELGAKYGPEVIYAESPARHVMVEFAFDVLEVARGAFKSDTYQNRIGFEVATPLLARAFRDTYGLELTHVFGDADLAIGTYRWAVSQVIPDMTRLAWRDKRDEILKANPDVAERDVVYTLTRAEYEKAYGTKYRKPGMLARFIVMLFRIVPKFGPFKPLAFKPLTPEADRLFADSFAVSTERYRRRLASLGAGRLSLRDVDLDTGRAPVAHVNSLADKTYLELLDKCVDAGFANVPPELRREINSHFATAIAARAPRARPNRRERGIDRQLALLNAVAAEPAPERR